jgi:hypothetical protein
MGYGWRLAQAIFYCPLPQPRVSHTQFLSSIGVVKIRSLLFCEMKLLETFEV